MSKTLVKTASAGAMAIAVYAAHASLEPVSATAGHCESGYRQLDSSARSAANSDLLSGLRDHYLFDDFSTIEQWLNEHPEHYASLLDASSQIDLIFGSGRLKCLSVLEDWEGTRVLGLEVEFGGSGEAASNLCRRFVSEWLVNQETDVRRSITLGVRFV